MTGSRMMSCSRVVSARTSQCMPMRRIAGTISAIKPTARFSYFATSARKATDHVSLDESKNLMVRVIDHCTGAFHSAFNNPEGRGPPRESLECRFVAFRD